MRVAPRRWYSFPIRHDSVLLTHRHAQRITPFLNRRFTKAAPQQLLFCAVKAARSRPQHLSTASVAVAMSIQ